MEKMLKEYSLKKIEEKLDLLMERKNIKSPAGWLRSALKNDYRGDKEQESRPTPHPHLNPPPSKEEETRGIDSRFRGNNIKVDGNDKCRGTMHRALNPQDNDKILSTEEARRRFHSLREQLMAMK